VPAHPLELSISPTQNENRDHFLDLLRNRCGLRIEQPVDGEPDTILLYKELTGLPLFLYSSLRQLASAYEQSKNPSHLHINFKDTKLHLPDIERVDAEVYRNLRDIAPQVLFAIMTGSIVMREDGVFYLLSRHGLSVQRIALASSLDRAIKEIARDHEKMNEVHDMHEAWLLERDEEELEMAARKTATLLVGIQQLMETTRQAIKVKGAHKQLANPIYYSGAHLQSELVARLGASSVGETYRARYDSESKQRDADLIYDARAACFQPAHTHFPIPVHNGNWIPALANGGSSRAAKAS
jgi:hypothetical protein